MPWLIVSMVLLLGTFAAFSSSMLRTASAATCNVSGAIASDETWSPALDCDPYVVTGNITVESGATLTIEAGTTVRFDSLRTMTIEGTLEVLGTSDEPVLFTSNGANIKGDWGHITFADSSSDATFDGSGTYVSGSIIRHAVIESAGGAVVANNGALRILAAAPYIENTTVRNSASVGMYVVGGDPRLVSNTIRDNGTEANPAAGIVYEYAAASGDPNPQIRSSIIQENTGNGITSSADVQMIDNTVSTNGRRGISMGADVGSGSYPTITGNTVTGHQESGIAVVANNNGTISNNTITNNATSGNGAALSFVADGAVTIDGNTIESNEADGSGGGIYYVGNGVGTISNNTITGNRAGLNNAAITRGGGGGIYYDSAGDGTISNNTITGNSAGMDNTSVSDGGGIYVVRGAPTIRDNTISNNSVTGATRAGGGIYLSFNGSNPTITTNNLVDNNSAVGSALFNGNQDTSPDVNAVDNWWGTSNTAQIEQMIYHFVDDTNRGVINYDTVLLGAIDTFPGAVPISEPSGCQVSGFIFTDTTWRPSNCAAYTLVGGLVVRSGATFTIEPGTIIRFNRNAALKIEGTLKARGTTTERIRFTAATNAAQGEWGYIVFTDSSTDATFDTEGNYTDGSIIQQAIVEYGGRDNLSLYNATLRILGSAPLIDQVTIREGRYSGIYVHDGSPRLTANEISGHGTDAIAAPGIVYEYAAIPDTQPLVSSNRITNNTGDGVVSSGNVVMQENIIDNNGGRGIRTSDGTGSYPTITGNTVTDNQEGGVYIGQSSNGTINGNVITNNTAGTDASSTLDGGGLYVLTGTATISGNVIANNRVLGTDRRGGGVFLGDGSNPVINNNNIVDNSGELGSAIYNANVNTRPDVDATRNWWGITDTIQIEDQVYHTPDDVALGTVRFTPTLTTAVGVESPPLPITDLVVTNTGNLQLQLIWTAPAASNGLAVAEYDIRYSLENITEANWSTATPLSQTLTPALPGSTEEITFSLLTPNNTWYFGIKSRDADGGESALSNVPSIFIPIVPPTTITDVIVAPDVISRQVRIAWTAPAAFGDETVDSYDIRYSGDVITGTGGPSWANAIPLTGEPTPASPGSRESIVVPLPVSNTLYVAMTSTDVNGYVSALSNVSRLQDTGFRSDQDGFQFGNFPVAPSDPRYPSEATAQDFTTNNLAEFLGNEVICLSARGDCAPKPTSILWHNSINRFLNAGHAEGLAYSSASFFSGVPPAVNNFQIDASTPADIQRENIRTHASYYTVAQYARQVVQQKDSSRQQSLDTIVDNLRNELAGASPEMATLFVRPAPGRNGHSLTPFAINDVSDEQTTIWVYDSEFPGEQRPLLITRTLATDVISWSYDTGTALGTWLGDDTTRTLGIVPLATYPQRTQELAECPVGSSWCDTESAGVPGRSRVGELWLHGEGHLLISNESGDRIGYDGSQFVNEIATGSVLNFDLGTRTSRSEPVYHLPLTENYDVSIDGQPLEEAESVGLSFFGPGFATSIVGMNLEPEQQEQVTLSATGRDINYTASADSSPTLTWAVETSDANSFYQLAGVDVAARQTIVAQLNTNTGQLTLNADDAGSGTYDLVLQRLVGATEDIFTRSGIEISSGATHIIDFSVWATSGAITLEIDDNSDGTVDRTEVLREPDDTRVEISSVNVTGPVTGTVGTQYTFTAQVGPSSATTPVTYSWQVDDREPVEQEGGLTDSFTTSWNGTGTRVIIVAVRNEISSSNDTHEIVISERQISQINVSASQSRLAANGSSTSEIQATVLDTAGNPVPNVTVEFSTTLGSLDPASAPTDESGVATTTLRSGTTAGIATITARVGTASGLTNVTFDASGQAVYLPLIVR